MHREVCTIKKDGLQVAGEKSQCANVKEASLLSRRIETSGAAGSEDDCDLALILVMTVAQCAMRRALHHWLSSLQSPSSFSESGETGLETVKMS